MNTRLELGESLQVVLFVQFLALVDQSSERLWPLLERSFLLLRELGCPHALLRILHLSLLNLGQLAGNRPLLDHLDVDLSPHLLQIILGLAVSSCLKVIPIDDLNLKADVLCLRSETLLDAR